MRLNKVSFDFKKVDNGIEINMYNYPKNINITAFDFGKALAKRAMEGYSPNPEEEIDVTSGIENEKTTGETITFKYVKGNKLSGIILLGVLAEKLIEQKILSHPYEVGGISYENKNESYIQIAIQKMIITEDSLGSSIEFFLPENINMSKFKSLFSFLAFDLIPEIEAIQFGLGCSVSKKISSNLGKSPKRVEISLAPHLDKKIPALALAYGIVFDSIVSLVLINI